MAETEQPKDAGSKPCWARREPRTPGCDGLWPSDVQADGHDEVDEAGSLVARLDQARPQRADQLQDQLLRLGALEALAGELRVEADLQRFAGERDGQGLARLAHVGR